MSIKTPLEVAREKCQPVEGTRWKAVGATAYWEFSSGALWYCQPNGRTLSTSTTIAWLDEFRGPRSLPSDPFPDGKPFDRLCRDIAAAPTRDMTLAEAEAELARHTRTFTVALKRTWEIGTDERSTEWSVCACPKGGSLFGLFSSTSLREAVAAAIKYMQPAASPLVDAVTAQIDLGDGLGLEVPERFDECTGPMVAVPACMVCGQTTLGADECRECRDRRCNDDREPIGCDERLGEGEVGHE